MIWFKNFLQHPSIQRLRHILTASSPLSIWWEISGESLKKSPASSSLQSCCLFQGSASERKLSRSCFSEKLEETRKTKIPQPFECRFQCHAVCFPVIPPDGTVAGVLAVCHSERPFTKQQIELAQLTIDTTVQEIERAGNLKELSETLQPRCVALSTVHTIHRLISSITNLEELLPRMGRLCCQVLRTQQCTIWLVDQDKKILIPRAAIDLSSQKKDHAQHYKTGAGLPGKVAETCQARLTKQMMIVPLVEEDCIGVILVKRDKQQPSFGTLDQEILTTLAEQAVVAIRNAQMYETQERITWGTVKSLSAILDGMDSHLPRHGSRRELLADVALAIAQKMGLSSAQQRPIAYAAMLHDAGRMGIPDEIFRKPNKLNPSEIAAIQEHPIKGARILQPLEILEPAVPIILYHHERYDGTGYPKGLKKEAIPLGARILAVANAFEAMIREKPYRSAMSMTKTTQEIESHSGTQFDPKVVHAFVQLIRTKKIESIMRSKLHKENWSADKGVHETK